MELGENLITGKNLMLIGFNEFVEDGIKKYKRNKCVIIIISDGVCEMESGSSMLFSEIAQEISDYKEKYSN
jgi:hypothetical protein